MMEVCILRNTYCSDLKALHSCIINLKTTRNMNRITNILIICFALTLVSCSSNNKRKSTHEQGEVASTIDVTDTTTDSEYVNTKSIDFFGVKMQGKYEDIVNNIYMLPMLSCVERRDTIKLQGNGEKWFSHTVEFCGVPCGMNADFTLNGDNIMSINDLCFITSQTDEAIIHKFVSELTKYYGEPDISDEKEDSYHWYLSSGLAVRARHFHAPEGGWTVFFYY